MSKKWMGVAAGVVGVAAVGGACAYILLKDDDFLKSRSKPSHNHKSSRPLTIDVRIPQDQAGVIIGKGGSNVREIEEKTDTKINFKDELETKEFKVMAITGSPENIKLAEILVHQSVSDRVRVGKSKNFGGDHFETLIMYVPYSCTGLIIGRGGEMVRSLEAQSQCSIIVARGPEPEDGRKKITLKGTKEQIEKAGKLIEDLVEADEFRPEDKGCEVKIEKPATATCDSTTKSSSLSPSVHHGQPLFLTSEPDPSATVSLSSSGLGKSSLFRQEELKATSADNLVEVYVSSICNPGHFYVQKVGPTSIALDKLVQDMTAFYDQDENREAYKLVPDALAVNDIVAVRFTSDGSWYRAKVAEIITDDYDEDNIQVIVDFVDFGDCETKSLDSVCDLKEEFLKLSFQAIPVTLADIKPKDGDDWSPEAADDFETITHAAQWKKLLAKIVRYEEPNVDDENDFDENVAMVPVLELVDTNTKDDIDIAEKLIELGHAVRTCAPDIQDEDADEPEDNNYEEEEEDH